jgi:hypothetical protein
MIGTLTQNAEITKLVQEVTVIIARMAAALRFEVEVDEDDD